MFEWRLSPTQKDCLSFHWLARLVNSVLQNLMGKVQANWQKLDLEKAPAGGWISMVDHLLHTQKVQFQLKPWHLQLKGIKWKVMWKTLTRWHPAQSPPSLSLLCWPRWIVSLESGEGSFLFSYKADPRKNSVWSLSHFPECQIYRPLPEVAGMESLGSPNAENILCK